MSEEEIVEELIKWFENYGVIIPDGSSATIKDFMAYCEIQSMAEELYEDFFADLQSQLAEKENRIKKLNLEAQKYYEDAYCNDFQKQTKIDFAVEQLEKLKVELHIIHTNGYLKAIDEEIDNQINGLKGEK